MFSWLRALLQRRSPQKLFNAPILPIPQGTPAWVKALSPTRRFSSLAEANCYAAELEHVRVIVRERGGQAAAGAEAEIRQNLGVSLANERPR
jgi:hypothetical protein